VSFTGCDSTSGTTCSVTMSAAKSVTVTFNKQYNLTLTKTGTGTGNVTSTPAGVSCGTSCTSQAVPFDSGTPVTLTATADANSSFVSFTGCDSTSGSTCSVTMSAAKSVTVPFNAVNYNLTLTKDTSGTGTVSVTSSLAGISSGTTCTTQTAPFAKNTRAAPTGTTDA